MPEGYFALVLHSHLPWLAHHGNWPVGEEWLYEAWATSYLPVLDVLDSWADDGITEALTLGVTPILAHQLDDPYCITGMSHWLAHWQLRSMELADAGDDFRLSARYEYQRAQLAMEQHERRGALSPSFRALSDAGVVELLGGPAAHPFQPLYPDDFVAAELQIGRDDARWRWGAATAGIWAPECGYRPGIEQLYAQQQISHFLVDGPTFRRAGVDTSRGRVVSGSDVVAFARDLDVTYRVWSPKKGYPSDSHYRDFFHRHPATGLRIHRVTSIHHDDKAPYDPEAVGWRIQRDAEDFVSIVRARLQAIADSEGQPGLVVAAYDTELFGHWWHEGPRWLDAVMRLLPECGIKPVTLQGALDRGLVAPAVDLPASSWGSGKDWRVWTGPQVADMVRDNDQLVRRWTACMQRVSSSEGTSRDYLADQLTREALLAVQSDWAFMVTKQSAEAYARSRHDEHHRRFHVLADLLEQPPRTRKDNDGALAEYRRSDDPFAFLDARTWQT